MQYAKLYNLRTKTEEVLAPLSKLHKGEKFMKKLVLMCMVLGLMVVPALALPTVDLTTVGLQPVPLPDLSAVRPFSRVGYNACYWIGSIRPVCQNRNDGEQHQ